MRSKYTLYMLMLAYTFSFLDRQIIAILAEDIKRDLVLSDTQLGVLTGLAFALFYAGLGVPIARLADRWHRISLISICLAVWSAMTAACGAAGNFIQLALARMGVGVGEAGALPASHSIIADTFPPENRSSAMAIFQLGVPGGVLVGFLVGGWMSDWYGWRATLYFVGGLGVALAVIIFLTAHEPKRPQVADAVVRAGMISTIGRLTKNPAYNHLCAAATLASLGGYALISWSPALLIREHGIALPVVGTALSLIIGLGSGLGTYFFGRLADAAGRRRDDGSLRVAAYSCFATAPFFLLGFNMPAPFTIFLVVTPGFILFFAWMGPIWAGVQGVAPVTARALASAFALFVLNMIGLGVGPVAVGALSDYFATRGVESTITAAVACILIVYPWAGWHFLRAGRHVAARQRSIRSDDVQPTEAIP
ncbi:MAG: MFS transporter [Chromatiales bacterium]|nr:MFS transporter [Chromatiales bacterium]MYC52198.1 MFS transporter [Gammaproteobacteria bacterium]